MKDDREIMAQVADILAELEGLGRAQTKKTYLSHGVREPLFGVTSGNLKPIAKRIKINYDLAMALYATGNYDAMYLAGMVADPQTMSRADFALWMRGAYCNSIGDYIVAVTLAESDLAQELADLWIDSGEEIAMSAGWSCYCWLLGSRADSEFDKIKVKRMLDRVRDQIHRMPNRTRYAMNSFMMTVGISYLPLHEEALATAYAVGKVVVEVGRTNCKTHLASQYILDAETKGRVGFKRKKVRC